VLKNLTLWYPRLTDISRTSEQPTMIVLGLDDVRAADDMFIDYDFERNGYRIRMVENEEWDEDGTGLVEVAFVPGDRKA
jgi:hypothetical protein